MPSPPSPVVANWELVLRLKERREQVGVNVNDLTKELGFTRNYWSAIENEHKIVPENTLRHLFEILEFTEADRHELLALREQAKETGWWSRYSALFDGTVRRYFGLEDGAQQIYAYETSLVAGLLQTAEYTRAIMRSDPTIRPVEIEQRVDVRMRRQQRLGGESPVHLTAVMSEGVLRQQVGGADVLRRQLDHLLATMERYPDNVEIRVVPFSAESCGLLGAGSLSLLDFPSPRLPRVAWYEAVTLWDVVTDVTRVRDISIAFDDARKRTLTPRETKKEIEKHRKEIR